ncbi:hypothetical protein [Pedobacter sandarakinus]|uniref:hypothetical protein n=1 Tax=Pedobacter sandarakinus TaxID=353156 RepID=UPI002246B34D|nr:hypothetical protein [Pedobacter sandarakinus]MCX2575188.1 hypothetical protein [Pedobacter sandarakinus]
MSKLSIQEQFNNYIELLNKIHNIDQDIDALINEVEITDLKEKRIIYKKTLQMVTRNLVASLKDMDSKYPIHNYLANQTTYLFTEGDKLMFEYH